MGVTASVAREYLLPLYEEYRPFRHFSVVDEHFPAMMDGFQLTTCDVHGWPVSGFCSRCMKYICPTCMAGCLGHTLVPLETFLAEDEGEELKEFAAQSTFMLELLLIELHKTYERALYKAMIENNVAVDNSLDFIGRMRLYKEQLGCKDRVLFVEGDLFPRLRSLIGFYKQLYVAFKCVEDGEDKDEETRRYARALVAYYSRHNPTLTSTDTVLECGNELRPNILVRNAIRCLHSMMSPTGLSGVDVSLCIPIGCTPVGEEQKVATHKTAYDAQLSVSERGDIIFCSPANGQLFVGSLVPGEDAECRVVRVQGGDNIRHCAVGHNGDVIAVSDSEVLGCKSRQLVRTPSVRSFRPMRKKVSTKGWVHCISTPSHDILYIDEERQLCTLDTHDLSAETNYRYKNMVGTFNSTEIECKHPVVLNELYSGVYAHFLRQGAPSRLVALCGLEPQLKTFVPSAGQPEDLKRAVFFGRIMEGKLGLVRGDETAKGEAPDRLEGLQCLTRIFQDVFVALLGNAWVLVRLSIA